MKILVADNEPRVTALLKSAFEAGGHTVDVASTGAEALDRSRAVDYDLIFLSVTIPSPDGLEVRRQLSERGRGSRVLLLSSHNGTLTRRAAEERDVALNVGDIRLDPATREVSVSGRPVDLTPREFALLELFLRNPGVVLNRSTILDHVWDLTFETTSNVVDVYVRYLRRKLDHGVQDTHIESVRGVGYRLTAPAQTSRSDPP